jgi:hypothetical protein
VSEEGRSNQEQIPPTQTDQTAPAQPPAPAGQQPRQLDLFIPPALQSLIDLERQRIESTNRRTEVTRFAIETNDAADKRQFDYQMAKLHSEDQATQRRHNLARNVAAYAGAGASLVLALLLVMAFFGDASQSATETQILIILGVGIGGYGVIEAAVRTVGRLLKNNSSGN